MTRTKRQVMALCLWFSAALCLALSGCAPGAEAGDSSDEERACVPDERSCLNSTNFRVCNPSGDGYDYGVCPEEMPCSEGLCGPSMAEEDAGAADTRPSAADSGAAPDTGGSPDTGQAMDTAQSQDTTAPPQDTGAASCMPGQRMCVSDTLLQVCRPDGSGYDMGTCTPEQPCRDGACGGGGGVPGTCIGDTRECLDNRTLRVCRTNGTAWDNLPCPGDQVCEANACRPLGDCTDNDRDGYGVGPGCLGLDCDDNAFTINPSGWEVCGNGQDEDCDGSDAPCDCDPITQNCPGDRLRCALNSNQEFACMGDGLLGEGEPCGGIPSNCSRGLICIQTDDRGSVCTRMCSPQTGVGCLGDAVCGATLVGFDNVGLCIGLTRCDPVDTPQSCPPGTHCDPFSDAEAACFEGTGTLSEDAPCQPGAGDCGAGLTCVTGPTGSMCKGYCKVSRGNTDCQRWRGQACQPLEITFTFLGRTETIRSYGVCSN